MDVHRLTRWFSFALVVSVLLIPAVALGQVEPGGVFCRDAEGCDRTGTVAESWTQAVLGLVTLGFSWVVATRRIRTVPSVAPAGTVNDPVAAATDRQRNVARVTALAHLTSSQTERRALFEGAPLGAIGALILAVWLGQRTGGEWAIILGGLHLIVFITVYASATFLVVQAPGRAVRAVFGLGVAAGLLLGWAVSWYIVEPIF